MALITDLSQDPSRFLKVSSKLKATAAPKNAGAKAELKSKKHEESGVRGLESLGHGKRSRIVASAARN